MEEELTRHLQSMASICSRREMCAKDIAEKLRRKELSERQIAAIIAELANRNFLNEERYARAYVRDKARLGGWGRNKIIMGMRAKGLSDKCINIALEEAGVNSFEQSILKAARTKAKRLDLNDYNDKVKLYRFLASRGYTSQEITHAIATVKKEQNDV